MTDLYKDIQRGDSARRVLDNPAFKEAVDSVRETLMKGWENSGAGQDREREKIWLMVRLLNNVTDALSDYITTGQFSYEQLLAEDSKHNANTGANVNTYTN